MTITKTNDGFKEDKSGIELFEEILLRQEFVGDKDGCTYRTTIRLWAVGTEKVKDRKAWFALIVQSGFA